MWPDFRKTLSWPVLIGVAVIHVACRTVELAGRHLLWEPERARRK